LQARIAAMRLARQIAPSEKNTFRDCVLYGQKMVLQPAGVAL
jgi:hypothetical protein